MWKTKFNFKNNVKWKRIFYPSSLRSLLKHPSLHLLNYSMRRLETVVSTLLVLHSIMLSLTSLYVVELMYLPFLTGTQSHLLIMLLSMNLP